MIDRRAVDIVHPDLLFVGGLHEGKKVADYADLNAIPLAIHNNGSAMNTIAEAHLGAACPNFIGLEYHFWDAKWIGQVVRREGVAAVRRRPATSRSPTRPGSGWRSTRRSPRATSHRANRCSEAAPRSLTVSLPPP